MREPCADQTFDEIEAYYRAAAIGDLAAMRSTQWGFLRYTVAKIVGGTPRVVDLDEACAWCGGTFYRKSGKARYAPTGQTTLVVPTKEVIDWAARHPKGMSWQDRDKLRDEIIARPLHRSRWPILTLKPRSVVLDAPARFGT